MPTMGAVTATSDIVYFDPRLVRAALKYQYQTARGLDNSVAFAEFTDALASAIGKNSGAKILSLTGGHQSGWFIDNTNLPNSGYEV